MQNGAAWADWVRHFATSNTAHKRQSLSVLAGYEDAAQQLLRLPHMVAEAQILQPLGLFAVMQATAIKPLCLALMHFAPKNMEAIHLGSATRASNCCIRWILDSLPVPTACSIVDVDQCNIYASMDGGAVSGGTLMTHMKATFGNDHKHSLARLCLSNTEPSAGMPMRGVCSAPRG